MNFWGFKKNILIILIVILYVILYWKYFYLYVIYPFINGWDAMAHFSIAKYYSDNIFPSFFGWSSAWYGGMPFPQFYPPIFYYIFSVLDNFLNVDPIVLFKILTLTILFSLPILVGFIYYKIVNRENNFYIWAILFSFLFVLMYSEISGGGFNLLGMLVNGMVPHALSLFFFCFWIIFAYQIRENKVNYFFATFFLILTLLSNVHIAFSCLLFYLLFFFKDIFKEENKNIKNILKIFLYYLYSGLIAIFVITFWFLPMIYYYDFSTARPLNYAWGSAFEFLFKYWFVFIFSFVTIIIGIYKKKFEFPHIFSLFSLLSFGFIFLNVEKINLPFHADRQFAVVFMLFPIVFIYLISHFKILYGKILLFLLFLLIIFYKIFFVVDIKIHGYYKNEIEFMEVVNILKKYGNSNILVEVFDLDAPYDSLISSIVGLNKGRLDHSNIRESSIAPIFFTPIKNQFSHQNTYWSTRSRLSLNNEFLNQKIDKKIENAKEIGIEYLLNIHKKTKNEIFLSKDIKFIDEVEGWSLGKILYKKNEDSNFKILENKPILIISDFETKKYVDNNLDFINFAEELMFQNQYEFNIVLGSEKDFNNLDDYSFVFVDKITFDEDPGIVNYFLDNTKNKKIFVPVDSGSEFNNSIKDERVVFYYSDLYKNFDEKYTKYLFGLIKENLIPLKIPKYQDVNFYDDKDFFAVSNSSNNDIQVLIKRSYFPTWLASSGQKVKLINPNFIAINLKAGQTETIYFSYPKVFYWGHYISLFGIILLVFVAFRKENQ